MTGNLGRRGVLQAGATMLGAAMMPGTVLAQAQKDPASKAGNKAANPRRSIIQKSSHQNNTPRQGSRGARFFA